MLALRSALRRRVPLRQYLPTIQRPQTTGPHKEYFQTPGQAPLPDTSPYSPNEPIQSFRSAGPSWTVRALRSIGWAALFGVLGGAAGVGLITWEYLQPPFERGSPEDAELFEEIAETLDSHPVAEDLRNDGWIEENFYTSKHSPNSGLNLVHDNLTGTKGVTVKAFRHPSLEYTILLAFTGFALEGWPDVLHGGVTASLMLEAVARHVNNFIVTGDTAWSPEMEPGGVSINIDYRKRCQPGEIYAIVCPPPGVERISTNPASKEFRFRLPAIVMRLEAAPRLGTEFDPLTNTQTNTMEIASSGGEDVTHAIATVEFVLAPPPDDQPDTPKISQGTTSGESGT